MCASKFGTNRNTLYTRVLAIVRRDARQLLAYGTIAPCRPDWNGAFRSLEALQIAAARRHSRNPPTRDDVDPRLGRCSGRGCRRRLGVGFGVTLRWDGPGADHQSAGGRRLSLIDRNRDGRDGRQLGNDRLRSGYSTLVRRLRSDRGDDSGRFQPLHHRDQHQLPPKMQLSEGRWRRRRLQQEHMFAWFTPLARPSPFVAQTATVTKSICSSIVRGVEPARALAFAAQWHTAHGLCGTRHGARAIVKASHSATDTSRRSAAAAALSRSAATCRQDFRPRRSADKLSDQPAHICERSESRWRGRDWPNEKLGEHSSTTAALPKGFSPRCRVRQEARSSAPTLRW